MGKGKGEMVVADDDFREHVRATIYWGKGYDDAKGKGKGYDHVRATIYWGKGYDDAKGKGKGKGNDKG